MHTLAGSAFDNHVTWDFMGLMNFLPPNQTIEELET